MTDAQKRLYVANLYPNRTWRRRVTKMSDEQVVAIFLKHQRDGIDPVPEPDPHLDVPPRPPHENENHFPIY